MKLIRILGSSFLTLALVTGLFITTGFESQAAYSYEVSFILGGTKDEGASFNSDLSSGLSVVSDTAKVEVLADRIVVSELQYNDEIVFNPKSAVAIANEDATTPAKYYVKGVRRSGSNDASTKSAFFVTQDDSYVIAYGVGAAVPYEVRYVDGAGNALAESATYYGVLGEELYIPYRYIDGYEPNASNLHCNSLKENQIFEFVYQKATAPAGTITYIDDSRTEYSTVQGSTEYVYEAVPRPAAETVNAGVTNNRNAARGGNAAAEEQNVDEQDAEQIDEPDVPAGREDVVDVQEIEDEEVPQKGFDEKAFDYIKRYCIVIAFLGMLIILITVIGLRLQKRERNKYN